MTDVRKDRTRLINSIEEARSLYAAPPAEYQGKIGLEVEMALYKPGVTKPQIPTAAEMLQMHADLKEKGHDAQLEAAGVLEYASPPVPVSDTPKLIAQAKTDIALFEAEAAKHGYTRAPFSILPTTTREEALENKVGRERLEAALAVIKDIYTPETANIPLLTTGVQASLSPRNNDEMFNMARRGYALVPLVIAAMNSGTGFACNDNTRQDAHVRSKYYEVYGASGGISEAFLKSTNGAELVDNHIREVFDAPMFFAFDQAGNMVRSTKGNVLTFAQLASMGMNTQANYELAESFLYNDIKICNLRDGEGNTMGKRIELRPADSGLHQPASVLLLAAALLPDGKTADDFDALLKDYGFTNNPREDAALLKASRAAVVDHGGRFMDVPFGKGSLRDFAADVAGLMVNHYGADKQVRAELSTLCHILLTGDCDAKRHAENYPQLSDVTAALQKNAANPAQLVAARVKKPSM